MNELQCVARLKIRDGKLDDFKRLAVKCGELVRTKDTGTLQYELYFKSMRVAAVLSRVNRPPSRQNGLRRDRSLQRGECRPL